MKKMIIIGSGLAGLGAAWRLQSAGIETEIFEKESRPGGLCRTEQQGEFLFDYTGHLLHFRNDVFRDIVFSLIGNNLQKRNRSAWIYSKNVYTRYPFQANLYGLPLEVVIDCVYEYSKQCFNLQKGKIANFEDWIMEHFGAGIAQHFMIPYNTKLYRRHPREMSADCIGRFVPQSDLKLLLRGALSDDAGEIGYNSVFYYPDRGGIESLVKGLVKGKNIHTSEKVERIDPDTRKAYTSTGREISYDYIISTQPVNELVRSIEGDIGAIRECAEVLKYVSVLNVNLGIKGVTGDRHWVYVPEERFLFHRLGYSHNFSSHMAPSGCGALYLEISYDPSVGIDKESTVSKSIEDLAVMGIIKSKEDVMAVNVIDIPYAYVVFNDDRPWVLKQIGAYMEGVAIYSAGRFGSWEYSSMEDAFMDGWKAAEKVLSQKECEPGVYGTTSIH